MLSSGPSANIMSPSDQDPITKAAAAADRTSTPPPPPPRRLNFAKTCNLLSQYVKVGTKGGGVNLAAATGICGLLEATAKSESATMKLLSNLQVSAPSGDLATSKCTSRPEDSTVMEAERSQMTIFYGGKVLVFDDFPADKARDLLLLAGNYVSPSGTGDVVTVAPPGNGISPPPAALEGHQQQMIDNHPSGLPTARRSSLHRFLEKRKDRAVARGPYHQPPLQNATDPSSSKNEEQLELKL